MNRSILQTFYNTYFYIAHADSVFILLDNDRIITPLAFKEEEFVVKAMTITNSPTLRKNFGEIWIFSEKP